MAAHLKTDLEKGISKSEIPARLAAFGVNEIPEERAQWYMEYLWESFKDFTIRLLCGCALFSIILAVTVERDEELSWVEGTTILITVCIVCNVQAAQDWMKERSFRRLNAQVRALSSPAIWQGFRSRDRGGRSLFESRPSAERDLSHPMR